MRQDLVELGTVGIVGRKEDKSIAAPRTAKGDNAGIALERPSGNISTDETF